VSPWRRGCRALTLGLQTRTVDVVVVIAVVHVGAGNGRQTVQRVGRVTVLRRGEPYQTDAGCFSCETGLARRRGRE
jgi:hypothetical protein